MSQLSSRFTNSIIAHMRQGTSHNTFYLHGLIDQLTIDEVKDISIKCEDGNLDNFMNDEKTELVISDVEDFRSSVLGCLDELKGDNELESVFIQMGDDRLSQISDIVKTSYLEQFQG